MKNTSKKCSEQTQSLILGKELYSQQLAATSDPRNRKRLEAVLADLEAKLAGIKTFESLLE